MDIVKMKTDHLEIQNFVHPPFKLNEYSVQICLSTVEFNKTLFKRKMTVVRIETETSDLNQKEARRRHARS